MPQITNWTIPNSGGSTFRATLNTTLAALQSSSSGPSSPSPAVAGMLWYDTTSSILRRRNTANTAWVEVNADTIAALTVRGNASGSAAAETSVSMASLRTMLGFSQSIGDNGYVEFPGGAICQWGTIAGTTNVNGDITVTYPITFPTASRKPIVSNGDDNQNHIVMVRNSTIVAGGFQVRSSLVSTSLRANFIVWGN